MKKLLIICLGMLLICHDRSCRAQNVPVPGGRADHYSDSLRTMLSRKLPDSVRIATLFLLSDYWSDKDTSQSLRYVRDGARLARPGSFQEALSFFYTGSAYFDVDYARSGKAYLAAEKLFRKFPGRDALIYRARAWHNFGALEQRQGREKKYAEVLLQHAIPLAAQAGDSVRMANNYHNLALIFSNQLDYVRAKGYFDTAITLLQRLGKTSLELADSYIFGAKNYLYLKDYPTVKPMLDSAAIILALHPNAAYQLDFQTVEGMYYSRIGQYEKALKSLNKGMALARELKREYDYQGMLLQVYFAYKSMGDYPRALEIIRGMIEQETPLTRPGNRKLYYYEYAQMLAKTGDNKVAFEWLNKYAELADSIFEERTKSEIAALETRFQSAEKEKQIYQLQANNEKAALTIKNNRLLNWLLAVVCLFLLAVTVLVLLFYRNNKRLWLQQKQLHDLEMQKIKQDYRISMLSAMLEGQEQERTRLARDLHDGLGGLLSSIKIELSGELSVRDERLRNSVTRTLSHLDDAVNELRRIARSLMPEILMNYGLAEATKEFCKNLRETGINLICQVFNYRDSIPKEKQILLYRIIQELVNNALKHAAAPQILVIIQQSGETLFVTVEDDGRGFDPDRVNSRAGAGLSNVKARADFLNAKFELQSSPQRGTSVTIECEI